MKRRKHIRGRHANAADREAVASLLEGLPLGREGLLAALHRVNDCHGCLLEGALVALAERLGLSVAEVFEVASFYHHFSITEAADGRPILRVCDSIVCEMHGAEALLSTLQTKFGDTLRIERAPCMGRCAHPPVATLEQQPIENATPEKIDSALRAEQAEIATTTPADYRQISQLVERGDRDTLTETITQSGLRGMGGAGFPTGRKWQLVRQHDGPRLMVVNIDEGEPGTFKDRFLLETALHRCIEGALIAAWAVEAEAVHFYLRDEYADCRRALEKALANLQADPPCPLPQLHLHRGAGAYVCGEESALIESIEGKRGMPRLRPPYIAEQGMFGRPTLAHNLETLYWVAETTERGADFFRQAGRNGRHGLRHFSLSGRVKNPGVYLAPAGISLRELIDEYGGGMADGHQLKAYFPGGAAGGILPASLADVPLDFDTLQPHGCFIGSAAVMVLSDQDSVKQAVLNALRFFADESCGQCTPCRSGTVRTVELLSQPQPDGALLEALAQVMQDASICGLGQAAPNPFLCLLRYFPEEVAS